MLQSAVLFLNGGTTETTTVVDTIIEEVPQVIQLMIDTMGNLLANPFFAFLFACGFVRIGMSLIRKAKKASR